MKFQLLAGLNDGIVVMFQGLTIGGRMRLLVVSRDRLMVMLMAVGMCMPAVRLTTRGWMQ